MVTMETFHGNTSLQGPWEAIRVGAPLSFLPLLQGPNTAIVSPALKSAWPQPPFFSMWREERAGKEKHVDLTRWKHANQKHMGSLVSFPHQPDCWNDLQEAKPSVFPLL